MAKVLIGFMGAGKTTVGRLLSDQLYDMDDLLVAEIGMPIVDFFASQGEAAFRQLETDLLQQLLAQPEAVISPGGGVVLRQVNRDLLKGHDIIFLETDFETVYERISQDTRAARPLFLSHSKAEFQAIFEERQSLYRDLATLTVQTDGKSPQVLAQEICEELRRAR